MIRMQQPVAMVTQPYRLRLPLPSQPLPPIVNGISYLTAVQDWGMLWHSHNGIEIIGVFSGQIQLETCRDQIIVPGGSLVAFDARQEHRVQVVSPPYSRWLLHLDADLLSKIAPPAFMNLIAAPCPILLRTRDRYSLDLAVHQLFAYFEHPGQYHQESMTIISWLLNVIIAGLTEKATYNQPAVGSDAEIRRIVGDIIATVHAQLLEGVSVESLADRHHYALPHLERLFKQEMGISIRQYMSLQRIEQSMRLLLTEQGDRSVSEIAAALGFNSLPYFSRYFKMHTGYTPSQFRAAVLGRKKIPA